MIPMSAHERSRLAQVVAIQEAAVALTLARGFRGFTMDDLAEKTGLSRRTIFTRVGDKVSAVLGPDDSSWDEPIAAGLDPTGSPLDTLVGATQVVAASFPIDDRVIQVNLGMREAIAREPHLAEEAESRSWRRAQTLAAMIADQRQWPVDDSRRMLLAALAQAIIDRALTQTFARYAEGGGADLAAELDDAARAARQLIEVSS